MLNHLPRWTQAVSLFVAVFFFYGCGVGGSGPATAAECATSPRPAVAANRDDNAVPAFRVNAEGGELRYHGDVAPGTSPLSVTVDPTGKFAYVANTGSNTVSVYTIDARTGALRNRRDIAGRSGKLAIAIVKDAALVRYTPKFAYVSKRVRAPSAPMRSASRPECSL